LRERVGLIYQELNRAWSQLRWEDVRPFVTDRFWQSQLYWINAYREQGLRNMLEDATPGEMHLARVVRDPFYDAITLRVFGSARDYTVQVKDGSVVSGNPRRPRVYSEYCTLVRSSKASGPARTEKHCPNCGAELKINMAGHCE